MTRAAAAKIRAVIVDDEELARQVLREFVAAHNEIELIAECANGFEAVKIVTEQKPDLMFLDIQMPKLDGFEVLELIGNDTAVVFVTAYDSYAIKAFEVHAVDYLLKPFGADRFEASLKRAKERLAGKLPETDAVRDRTSRRRSPSSAISRPHRGARRHSRLHHSARQARLRRGSGRLRRPGRRRQEASEATNHLQPGIRARSLALHAHPPLLHRQPRTSSQGRALRQRQPHRGAGKRHTDFP